MYQKIVAAVAMVLLLGTVETVNACGVCGCSMSNFNPELMMTSGSHSLGLFSQARWYTARLHNHGPGELGLGYSKYRQLQSTFELRGSVYATQKLSFTGILPISRNVLWREGETVESHTGLGDVMLIANYQVLKEGNRLKNKGWQQRLLAGAGVKLPTGRFREAGYNGDLTPSLQNGTGSVDFLFLAGYFINFSKFAVSSNFNYKVNTRNRDDFRFANSLNAEVRGMYIKKFSKATLSSALGLRLESAGNITEDGFYDLDSGGEALFALAGVEVYHRNLSFSATYLQPFWNQLTGEQFTPVTGIQAGFKYSFTKKKVETDQNL